MFLKASSVEDSVLKDLGSPKRGNNSKVLGRREAGKDFSLQEDPEHSPRVVPRMDTGRACKCHSISDTCKFLEAANSRVSEMIRI